MVHRLIFTLSNKWNDTRLSLITSIPTIGLGTFDNACLAYRDGLYCPRDLVCPGPVVDEDRTGQEPWI